MRKVPLVLGLVLVMTGSAMAVQPLNDNQMDTAVAGVASSPVFPTSASGINPPAIAVDGADGSIAVPGCVAQSCPPPAPPPAPTSPNTTSSSGPCPGGEATCALPLGNFLTFCPPGGCPPPPPPPNAPPSAQFSYTLTINGISLQAAQVRP